MAHKEQSTAIPRPRAMTAVAEDQGQLLRAGEQRFWREFGRMPCGMMVTSLAVGRPNLYLAANDAFCELTGYSWEELAGRDFLGDIHPDEQSVLDARIQQIMAADGGDVRIESQLIRKDGEAVVVRLTGSAIQPSAQERYLAIFVEDITAAEQARAEARQFERELARSRRMESLGQLVGGIAHDFNNLLTVIASYASLVRDEVSVAEAADSMTRWGPVRADVEQIQDAADRAKMLIKHMLAFARREAATPQDIDLSHVISDASLVLKDLLGEHIPLIVQPGTGVWPVRADPARLEQMITNIAANARDAMPAGGQFTIGTGNIDTTSMDSADLTIGRRDTDELGELLPGHYVWLRITDTGCGMDPVIAERAFEPFFTTKDGNRGAGLGLTAVQRFATQAGGKAWLQSESGAGTTVTVVLPAAPGAGWEAAADDAAPGQVEPQAGSVLVIDDELQIREVVHRVLTSAGYRVATAANGQEALTFLGDPRMSADLVLTDIVMPGISGQAFAAQAQAMRPGLQVLFMSGYERPDNTAGSWPDATMPVIGKPFSRAALLATVAQMMAPAPGK